MTVLLEIVKQKSSALRWLLRLGLILPLGVMMSSCGGGGGSTTTPPQPPPATDSLTQADVQMLVQAAATAAQSDSTVIAVVDRLGRILAVYKEPSAPATTPGRWSCSHQPVAWLEVGSATTPLAQAAAIVRPLQGGSALVVRNTMWPGCCSTIAASRPRAPCGPV